MAGYDHPASSRANRRGATSEFEQPVIMYDDKPSVTRRSNAYTNAYARNQRRAEVDFVDSFHRRAHLASSRPRQRSPRGSHRPPYYRPVGDLYTPRYDDRNSREHRESDHISRHQSQSLTGLPPHPATNSDSAATERQKVELALQITELERQLATQHRLIAAKAALLDQTQKKFNEKDRNLAAALGKVRKLSLEMREAAAAHDTHAEVFRDGKKQMSKLIEAANVARREVSAGQHQNATIEKEAGAYRAIIKQLLEDPYSVDKEAMLDQIGEHFSASQLAIQQRKDATAARIELAAQYDSVVLDGDEIAKRWPVPFHDHPQGSVLERRLRSKDYRPDYENVEADISSVHTPWKRKHQEMEDDRPDRARGLSPSFLYDSFKQVGTDFTKAEHRAMLKKWKDVSLEQWGYKTRWGEIAEAVIAAGKGRSVYECIQHFRKTGKETEWEEHSAIWKDERKAYDQAWKGMASP